MVPLMVVADNISAFKKTGIVPNMAMATMVRRPNFSVCPKFKSIDTNFENDENVESKVEAAEVIIIKLMAISTTILND